MGMVLVMLMLMLGPSTPQTLGKDKSSAQLAAARA
jgi:hypothetical protein